MTFKRPQERMEVHRYFETVFVFYFCAITTMNLAS